MRTALSRRSSAPVLWLALTVAAASACGDAPPPPPKAAPSRTVRVHVQNSSRFAICKVEACGQPGRPLDAEGPRPDAPLKQHESSLYEVARCANPIKAVACVEPGAAVPCLQAEGGSAQDGTMFTVKTCSY